MQAGRDVQADRGHDEPGRQQKSRTTLIVLVSALALALAGFTALGIWQIYRLQWKLALIERVEARIHATAVAAPSPADWPQVSADRDEYRHVRLQGRFLSGLDTRVKAVTDFGGGYWLLSPFQRPDNSIVLVNRGFVPENWKGNAESADTEVSGLLRLSETGGGFLRKNEPAADRWYSRDVAAIAEARGLNNVAPYFVDANGEGPRSALTGTEAAAMTASAEGPWPRAGLTVVRFANNHLGYAITWFVLALMCGGAIYWLLRDWRRT